MNYLEASADREAMFEVKASLLSRGINYPIDFFEGYHGKAYYENTYGYCITNKNARRENRIPQVLHLPHELVVSVLRREDSPWTLATDGQRIDLHYHGDFVSQVELPDALPFFGKTMSDGTLSDDVISVSGAVTPGFFFYSDCHYFPKQAPCSFCSLKHARATAGKKLVKTFSETQMREAAQLIQSEWKNIPMFTNTCGTPETDEGTRKFIIEPLRHFYDALDPKIPIHMLIHPPNDFRLFHELKDAGVTSIGLNLEIYDRQLFNEICPGKEKFYGYEKWWDALAYAKDVFGEFRAYCGLIWGLEPLESSMEGMAEIMRRGVGLSTNVFHADPGSIFARYPQPSTEDIMRLSYYESELYAQYPRFSTIYSVSMRNTLDWEIHQGYLRDAGRAENAAPQTYRRSA
jgi:bacteriochlorophyllide c C-7(1)-hydroxylase